MSHKKNSAGKQIDPSNTSDDNLLIAVYGTAALTPKQREALRRIGLFEKHHHQEILTRIDGLKKYYFRLNVTDSEVGHLLQERPELKEKPKLNRAVPYLARTWSTKIAPVLLSALLDMNPQPFKDYAAAIEAAHIDRRKKPASDIAAHINRIAVLCGPKKKWRDMMFTKAFFKSELKKRLGRNVDYKSIKEHCVKQGIALQPGKRGRPRKIGD